MKKDINNFLGIKKKIKFKKEKNKISVEIKRLLKFWNELPSVPKHLRKTTKVYKNTCSSIDKLLRGKYFKDKTISPKSFPVKKRGSIDFRNKKYSINQIKLIMERMSKLYDKDYWPKNKDCLPRSFPSLLHNPVSGYSWYIAVSFRDVKKIDEIEIESKYLKLVKINFAALTPEDKLRLQKGMNTITAYHKNLKKDTYGKIKYKFPDPVSLLKEYTKYLDTEGLFKDHKIGYFNTDSKVWNMFLLYVESNLGLKLST